MTDNVVENQYAKDDAEFREIVTQRYMYNAEKCDKIPLVGHLLNMVEMPPIRGRAWCAFLVKTTRPTRAVGRDEQIIDVPVGSEVLIPATYMLQNALQKASLNENAIYEVKIVPTSKIDIGGGQSMWDYKLAAKPNPQRRSAFGLAAVLAPLQLPAASTQTQDNDSPF